MTAAAGLVVALAVAIVSALAAVVVAVLRLTRRSPESREQDTKAVDGIITGQSTLTKDQATFIDTLRTELTDLRTRLGSAEEKLSTTQAEVRVLREESVTYRRLVSGYFRDLVAWGRTGLGGEPPAPPVGLEFDPH